MTRLISSGRPDEDLNNLALNTHVSLGDERIVVKIGGDLFPEAIPKIAKDLASVVGRYRVLVVHGGGNEVTRIARKMGKEPRFVVSTSGFVSRYTDREMSDIFEMVMAGRINKEIVRILHGHSVNAIGLSGLDGALIRAKRKEAIRVVEGGRRMILRGDYTGRIVDVNAGLLELLLDAGYVPVLAPVAMGLGHKALNVDGDRAAAHVASAVKASTLIFLTDVEGVMLDGALVKRLKGVERIRDLVARVGRGMKRKVFASLEALSGGVRRTVIASGLRDRPVTVALALEGCTVLEG
ncbi:TPA: [LysW]-aminoadipate kinase [Candidatus Bathyarchaeota archaeon]|nr:[LysW]-aminoadipate kinase [Candidatus Bathyarchaeota archaeon]